MGSVFTKENLFGGKAPKPETRSSGLGIGSGAVAPSVHKVTVSSHDQTILDLKNQRRRLKAQCKRVQSTVSILDDSVRKMIKDGRRQDALLILKRKKIHVSLLDQTEAQLLKLDQMVAEVESAVVTAEVFKALCDGNAILSEMNRALSPEKAQELLDEQEEQIGIASEVGAILGASIGSEAEHEELEADLAALEAEFDLDARMQAQPTITGEKRPRDPLEFVDKRSHASAATELTAQHSKPKREALPASKREALPA